MPPYRLPARNRQTAPRLTANWASIGKPDWPDANGWAALREKDRLDSLVAPATVDISGGELSLEFQLPVPAISLLRLSPES